MSLAILVGGQRPIIEPTPVAPTAAAAKPPLPSGILTGRQK